MRCKPLTRTLLRAATLGPAKASATAHADTRTRSNVDIDSAYQLRERDIQSYRSSGFVKLSNVFDDSTLAHYAPTMSLEVKQADKTPLQQDPDYQQAFTQVLMFALQLIVVQLVMLH